MPTGYTACIEDGVTFKEFMWGCARGMGALVMMREEPNDAPIPERFEPLDYHAKKLKDIEKELTSIKGMTDKRAESKATKEYEDKVAENEKYIRKNMAHREKYTEMLSSVNAWIPPSVDHIHFKEFMQEQIKSSMDFDCSTSYYEDHPPKRLTGREWKDSKIESILHDLAYHKKENIKEIERTEGRNVWLKQLRGSLSST